MNAVVTGASQGLGETIAIELAKEGFNLALAARSLDKLQALKEKIEGDHGVKVSVHSVDFSKRFEVENFAQSLEFSYEQIDLLVNNVGTYMETEFGAKPNLQRMMSINFDGSYYLVNTLMPSFTKKGKGHLFHICSVLSKASRKGAADYAISKHALYALHLSLIEEFKGSDLRSTAILPGSINTTSWDGSDAPVHEFVQPVDIARAIVFAFTSQPGTKVDEISLSPLNPNF